MRAREVSLLVVKEVEDRLVRRVDEIKSQGLGNNDEGGEVKVKVNPICALGSASSSCI